MTNELSLPTGAVSKEKILSALTRLIDRPEPRLLKSEVREALGFFIRHEEREASVVKRAETAAPTDAVHQLDEILRKFKERQQKK